MVVIRVSSDGRLLNSRPCSNCLQYMKAFGVKWVYYSSETGDMVKERISTMTTYHDSLSIKIYKEKKKLRE